MDSDQCSDAAIESQLDPLGGGGGGVVIDEVATVTPEMMARLVGSGNDAAANGANDEL